MLTLLLILLGADPVDATHWEHQKIEAVRELVAAIDAAALTTRRSSCQFEKRTMRSDVNRVVRYYEWSVGGDDSSDTLHYSYDEAGNLRFLFASGGAVPSAHRETRIWFDEDGKRLWRTHKFSGEGMDLDPEGLKGFVLRDPKKHFTSPQTSGRSRCGEEPWER